MKLPDMIIYYDHVWVCFLYLTIMPGNIVRILPPSATKFSIPDLQCKNHKDAGDQGDDSRPCGGGFPLGDPMAGSGVMHRQSPGSFKISQ